MRVRAGNRPYSVGSEEVNMAGRMIADCRDFPSESGCTLTIAGQEDEVLEAAVAHAVAAHQHHPGPELREMIRTSLKAE